MHFNKIKAIVLLMALCSIFFISSLSYADALDTQLSRDKIALGETLTLSFTLTSNASTPSPDFSALENDFRILGTNYGNTINMLNGAITTQSFWQLTLEPKKAGVIMIPEINFGQLKSAARKLVIEETRNPVMNTRQDDAPVFVQAEVNTTTPYIQSQVLYTFKLFYQSPLDNPRVEIPQIKDATFVQLSDANYYQTIIKGKTFLVVEKNFAFFPQKSGTIVIPSSHFTALTYDANSNVTNNPFYMTTSKTLSLATQAFTLTVRNIPDSFSGSTWLPAKNISLTEKWSSHPDQWELGNPVTRTITVKAQGLRADQIPDLSIDKIAGMTIYVDPPKRSNSIQNNTMIGSLEQKITYLPNLSQSFTIPVLKLNWWNLQTNTNAIAQLNSLTVLMKGKIINTFSIPSNRTPNSTAISASNPTSNIPAKINVVSDPFYLSIWFWIAVFLLITWVITLWLIWRKRSDKNKHVNSVSRQDKHPVDIAIELSDKNFEQACEKGDAAFAQQFLLFWAKKRWPETSLNLEKLRDSICDVNFKLALTHLEQAIYAKEVVSWDGHALLAAYQQWKKQGNNHPSSVINTKQTRGGQLDPLPPLNP